MKTILFSLAVFASQSLAGHESDGLFELQPDPEQDLSEVLAQGKIHAANVIKNYREDVQNQLDMSKATSPFEEPTSLIIKDQSAKIQGQIKKTLKDLAPQMQDALTKMKELEMSDAEDLAEFAAKQKNSPQRQAVEAQVQKVVKNMKK